MLELSKLAEIPIHMPQLETGTYIQSTFSYIRRLFATYKYQSPKPIIIGPVTLFIITFMLRTYAVYAGLTLYWYLLFCAVEGLAGCHYTFDVACLAILINYSSMEESKPFMVIGICTSQIAAGYMKKWTGYTYPFLTGACVLVFQ
jgi:hypothetical protein